MSLFGSSSKSTSTGTTNPTNPKPVTDSIIDFTKLIASLGGKDPNQYVNGPSNLQNQAFSMGAGIANRYGTQTGQVQQQSQPTYGALKPQSQGAGTLYGSAGIQPEAQLDYQGYFDKNPDLQAYYRSTVVPAKSQADFAKIGADYDNNGVISEEEFARQHYGQYGKTEGRNITDLTAQGSSGSMPGVISTGNGQYQSGQYGDAEKLNLAAPGYGYGAATMPGVNPVQQYQQASQMAMNAGNSGPNLGQVSTIGDDQRVDIGNANSGNASRGSQFSKEYENQYTDNVVNTTLAGFDENAGRLRAAEAASAAGNNAFGGSRYGVQRAVTEEGLSRDRASQEANLRFSAQDKAFGFGMQDADRFTNTSLQNASMANQRQESQAAMDFNRLLANMGANNDMSKFNAGQGDTAQARQLAASGVMGDLANSAGANERADLATLAQLGTDERGIQQQQSTADLQLMQLMAQLYGTMPYDLFNGNNTTGTMKVKETPSTLTSANQLLDFGGKAAAIFG